MAHKRCRKCGMFPSEHSPWSCTGAFDPYHTTGLPDYVHVGGSPDRSLSAEDFVRQQLALATQ